MCLKIRVRRCFVGVFLLVLGFGLLAGPGFSAAAVANRTVIDMAGRTVALNGPVQRLVTTFKPATLCVFSLGLQKKLVGIDTESTRDPLQRAVYPEVTGITTVGSKSSGINLETLVSLQPDLVILYAQKDGRELADRLATMGIPAIVILPETFSSIQATLDLIARAGGRAGQGVPAAEAMDTVLALVEAHLVSLTPEKRKTAYFASPRGLFSTATGSMLQDEILHKAGLVNVSHDLYGYFRDVSPEQLIRWNPEVIVLSQCLGKSVLRHLENPALQSITAVSRKAVYRSPSSLSPWDFPSPLSALAVLWLAEKAYPEHFSDVNARSVINQFHRQLFGKSLDEMNGTLSDTIYPAP